MSYDVLLASRQMLIVFFCGRAIQTRSCSHSDQGPAPDMQNRMKRTMALTLQVGELFGEPGPGCGVSVVVPSQLVAPKDHGVPKFGLKSSHVRVRHRNA